MSKIIDDIKKDQVEDHAILEKLKKLLEDHGKSHILTEEETEKVRKMIAVYESFEAFGRLAKFFRTTVIFLGTLLVGWFILADNAGIAWKKLLIFLFG